MPKREPPKLKKKDPAGINVGVRVIRCSECDRNCETCVYKRKFEELMELPNCNNCELNKAYGCSARPKPGEYVRINCPLHIPKEEAPR